MRETPTLPRHSLTKLDQTSFRILNTQEYTIHSHIKGCHVCFNNK